MAIGASNIGLGIVFTLTDKVSQNARKIGKSIDTMNNRIKSSANKITGHFDKVSGAFVSTAMTSAALIAPFAIAVKKSSEFGAQMSDVGAKSQATSTQLKALSEQALELSSAQGTAQFTAKQAGEGMSFLAMAGFNTEQIMSAIPSTMMLASAGNLSLAESADIASNVMSGFNLKATDMGRITDVLALAATKSNQSVSQLGEGMKFLAPTAAALRIPLEEATAATMMLANAGIQGSLGTRALGTSLAARLTQPTKRAAIMMKDLGLEAFNAQGNFVGLISLIRNMEKSTANLTQKQKQATIATIFGAESIQEINVLMTQQAEVMENGTKKILVGADALAHYTKMNENASGTAKQIAQQQLDNLKGDITVLLSTIDTGLIRLGATLEPFLRPLAQTMADVVTSATAFISTPLGSFLTKVSAGIAATAAGLVLLNFSINIVGKSFMGMAKAAISAMIPLAPYILIGAAIAGTIYLISKSVRSFQDVMNGTSEPANGFLGFMQKIGGVISGVIEVFKTWNGETFVLSKTMHDALQKTGALQYFQNVATWVTRTIEFTKGFGKGFMDVVGPLAKVFTSAFKSIWKATASVMKLFGKTNSSLIGVKSSGESMGKILGNALKIVMMPLELLVRGIGLLADAIGFVADKWNGWMDSMASGWADVKKGFSIAFELFGMAFDSIFGKVGQFIDYIKNLPKVIGDYAVSMGNALSDGIIAGMKGLQQMIAQEVIGIFGEDVGGKINSSFGISAVDGAESISTPNLVMSPSRFEALSVNPYGGLGNTETIRETNTVRDRVPLNVKVNVDGREIAASVSEYDQLDDEYS